MAGKGCMMRPKAYREGGTMGTERIDTKSLLAENRKTCDWVTSRGLTFSMSGDDAREILDALAQELSDAAVLRERIRLLEELVDYGAAHYDIAPKGLRWW